MTEVVPQRLTIVVPTSGAFDSRTFRIATTCATRGHEVTVLGRSEPGLPDDERHPEGYRIVRVGVDPLHALPGSTVWRRLRRGAGTPAVASDAAPSGAPRSVDTRRGGGSKLRSLVTVVRRLTAIGLTVRAQAAAARRIDGGADLYHAMAYMGLPVALSIADEWRPAAGRRPPVVYDARDIYLEARNLARLPRPARWLVGRVERRWAHRASRVATVNLAYADVLAERLGVRLPLVVMNCSVRDARPVDRPRLLHERLGIAEERPIVLYHGGLFPERGIEQLIAAIVHVPDAHLVLMGYGLLERELPARIAASPAANRIHLLPAVTPDVLHDWVTSADIAAMPIQPTTLNHRLTTPNKLFEAMAAGVPVVASDLPGMSSIVRETGCGVVCDPTDPVAIADAIRVILDKPAVERSAIGDRGLQAVRDTYNWEAQADVLLAEYGRLTGQPW